MGTDNTAGYISVKEESEADSAYTRFSKLVVPDGSLTGKLDGADELHLDITGATWVELAVSAYADIATAVSTIGATPATLVIDSAETVSTALVIPATLFLRIAKGASLTKSGSGTITFQGLGLDNPDHKQPIFFGFAAGDVTWSGTVYPHELSTEWWDTGNVSLQDRYNCADLAIVGKYAVIKAYPRTITTATAIIGENHHLRITAGDYPNTCATYGTTYWPPFLMKNYSSIIGEPGNKIHESPVDGNAYLIQGWHVRSGGGETDGMQTHLIVEGLYVVGDPAQLDISASGSQIILGNAHYSAIRHCTFYETHNYTNVLGLYGNTGNYAYQSEIAYNTYIGIGTQVAVLLNAKSCRIANNWFDQRNSTGTSSYSTIDIEPNVATDVIEDCIIENNIIDARDVTDGSKYAGAMAVQAALSGSMKNITIRNNKLYGRPLYPVPTDNLPMANGILVTGTTELYVYDNEVRGAFQRAYQFDRCRYVRAYDNLGTQCSDANADQGAMLIQACADSDFYHNVFNESPATFTQSTGIIEEEVSHAVTTSASTITNIYDLGFLKLFFDLYKGLTVTINNTDYVISGFTSQTILTTSTAVGTLTQKTFVDANVTVGTDNIAITAHGHNTGSKVWLTTTGTVPAGLTNQLAYFVIRVDADNLKLASTKALALAGTPVNITAAAGGGTHTLTPMMVTKFSNNKYWGNKAPDGITLEPTGTSVVYNQHDTQLTDYVAPDHSVELTALVSSPVDTILGTITETQIDPVTWTNMVGVTQSGVDNKLTKSGAGGAFDAGAFSVESIPEGGYLEWTCTEATTDRFIGLAYADTNQHYNTIDYCVYMAASGSMQAYNLGTGVGSTPSYTANTTVVRMTRVGNTIEISKDGAAPFHTFTSVPAGSMHVDTSLYNNGATIGGVVLGGIGDVEPLTVAEAQTLLGISSTASINDQTGTSYTLVAGDNGKVVALNNAAAITLTVPAGLGVGFNCMVVQKGAGQVTFTASGTTIRQRQSHTKTAGQYAACSLVAHVANDFILGGDTAA